MKKIGFLISALSLVCAQASLAVEEPIKIGVLLPLSGPFSLIGQEVQFGIDTFLHDHGATFGSRPVQVIYRDTQGVADVAKRAAQELIVNDKVVLLSGIGTTPDGLAIAPLATQAKMPMVVMGSGGAAINAASPYAVRASFTSGQVAQVAGEYFGSHGVKVAITLASDYAPGLESESSFQKAFEAAGGKVIDHLRPPFNSPQFAPYLQKAAEQRPDGVFMFVPTGQNGSLMREYEERGLSKAGIKLMTVGNVVDETLIDQIGASALGVESAYHYSDVHPSELNKKFVATFEKVSHGLRANMMGVGGYDGMQLIEMALRKTGGSTNGSALLEAMKGMQWESPRGPVSIDPTSRGLIQNVYMRRVEKHGERLVNVEFATYSNVKDPTE